MNKLEISTNCVRDTTRSEALENALDELGSSIRNLDALRDRIAGSNSGAECVPDCPKTTASLSAVLANTPSTILTYSDTVQKLTQELRDLLF